jgi:hypothetical protein
MEDEEDIIRPSRLDELINDRVPPELREDLSTMSTVFGCPDTTHPRATMMLWRCLFGERVDFEEDAIIFAALLGIPILGPDLTEFPPQMDEVTYSVAVPVGGNREPLQFPILQSYGERSIYYVWLHDVLVFLASFFITAMENVDDLRIDFASFLCLIHASLGPCRTNMHMFIYQLLLAAYEMGNLILRPGMPVSVVQGKDWLPIEFLLAHTINENGPAAVLHKDNELAGVHYKLLKLPWGDKIPNFPDPNAILPAKIWLEKAFVLVQELGTQVIPLPTPNFISTATVLLHFNATLTPLLVPKLFGRTATFPVIEYHGDQDYLVRLQTLLIKLYDVLRTPGIRLSAIYINLFDEYIINASEYCYLFSPMNTLTILRLLTTEMREIILWAGEFLYAHPWGYMYPQPGVFGPAFDILREYALMIPHRQIPGENPDELLFEDVPTGDPEALRLFALSAEYRPSNISFMMAVVIEALSYIEWLTNIAHRPNIPIEITEVAEFFAFMTLGDGTPQPPFITHIVNHGLIGGPTRLTPGDRLFLPQLQYCEVRAPNGGRYEIGNPFFYDRTGHAFPAINPRQMEVLYEYAMRVEKPKNFGVVFSTHHTTLRFHGVQLIPPECGRLTQTYFWLIIQMAMALATTFRHLAHGHFHFPMAHDLIIFLEAVREQLSAADPTYGTNKVEIEHPIPSRWADRC